MKAKEEFLIVSLLCNMAGVLLAVMSGVMGSMFILLAMVLTGCGFWCSIEASRQRARVRCKRSLHSNSVKFCEDFARQLDRESKADKPEIVYTDIGAVVKGKGREEFKKTSGEIIKKIHPVW